MRNASWKGVPGPAAQTISRWSGRSSTRSDTKASRPRLRPAQAGSATCCSNRRVGPGLTLPWGTGAQTVRIPRCRSSSLGTSSAATRPIPHSVQMPHSRPRLRQRAIDVLDLGGGRAVGLIVGVIRHEREVQLRLRPRLEVAQRGEVARVVSGLGHGERRPVDRPPGRRDDGVEKVDLHPQRLGLLEVLVAIVAVAEVHADRDVRGDRSTQRTNAGRDLVHRHRRARAPSRPPRARTPRQRPIARRSGRAAVSPGHRRGRQTACLRRATATAGHDLGHDRPPPSDASGRRVLHLEAHAGRDRTRRSGADRRCQETFAYSSA